MIIFLRHGERADQCNDQKERKNIETYFDPHLTKVGGEQSQLSGKFIRSLVEQHASRFGIDAKEVQPVVMCSPFIRCVTTARNAVEQLDNIYQNSIFIQEDLTEVMLACDFDHDVLPELKLRTEDPKKLDEKYFQLGKISLQKNYFENANLVKPICPESWTQVGKRLSTFTSILIDKYVKETDFRKHVFICVTHQGVLQGVMDALNIKYDYLDFCAILQLVFPNIEKGDTKFEVPVKGLSVWKK